MYFSLLITAVCSSFQRRHGTNIVREALNTDLMINQNVTRQHNQNSSDMLFNTNLANTFNNLIYSYRAIHIRAP